MIKNFKKYNLLIISADYGISENSLKPKLIEKF